MTMGRRNSMSRTKIPYDLIHKIENKYGSISKTPKDDSTLAIIQKTLAFDWHNSTLKVQIDDSISKSWPSMHVKHTH